MIHKRFTCSFLSLNIFLVVFCSCIYSQDSGQQDSLSSRSAYKVVLSDICDLKEDGLKLLYQPCSWETSDWLRLSAVTGITALLFTVDKNVDNLVSKNPGYDNSIPVKFGRWTGESVTSIAISGSFYLYGLASDNKEFRQIGFEAGESMLCSGFITVLLKYSLGRWRPYNKSGTQQYSPFKFGSDDFMSLPSGHSTLAFSLATVLSSHVENDWLKALIYTPAFLTAASRVYQHKHWASDVFLGASIGYFTGRFITGRHRDEENKKDISFGIGMNNSFYVFIPL